MPTYMKNILQFDIKQVSIYSSCDMNGGSISVPLVLSWYTLSYFCQRVDNVWGGHDLRFLPFVAIMPIQGGAVEILKHHMINNHSIASLELLKYF